jgi:hypothetical protein
MHPPPQSVYKRLAQYFPTLSQFTCRCADKTLDLTGFKGTSAGPHQIKALIDTAAVLPEKRDAQSAAG